MIYVCFLVLYHVARPCIRSSTNIYLSILAFVDAFLLLFIYVLSHQYRAGIHHHSHEVFWRTFGLTQWFYTAFRELLICGCKLQSECLRNFLPCSVYHSICNVESGTESLCGRQPSQHGTKLQHPASKECRLP